MTREEFEDVVRELEGEAKTKPQIYKAKVLLLSLLGYGYIGIVLVGLIAAVVLIILLASSISSFGFVWKLIIPLLAFFFYILRSLWVRIPAPEGVVLSRADAKPLFALAQEFARKLRAPKPHSILLTGDFNAGVVQVPRLGLFGWHKNYLLVGMPLLQALSPQEFQGVIAHEFGHLSGRHGHFASWVYRIRQTWVQLINSLESRRHWGTAVFSKFLQWYVPFFNAYTFVLARAQEYEADRSAAEIVGPRKFAEALIKIDIIGAFLNANFWPGFYRNAGNEPEPPSSPYEEMSRAFKSGINPDDKTALLNLVIESKTSSDDTHPCLSDRLSALGEQATTLAHTYETAAQQLLGDNERRLCDEVAKDWRDKIFASWRDRHRQVQEGRRQLDALEEKAQAGQLQLNEAWDRARFTEEFRDGESALPLYQSVLALDEKHAGASFAIGRLTINKNDSSAISLIESAMNLQHEFVIPGCEIIHNYLVSTGRSVEAEKYRNWALNQSSSYEEATKERQTISHDSLFISHDLAGEELTKICDQLRNYSEVKEGYLVNKKLKYFPEVPLYVLGVEPVSPWSKRVTFKDTVDIASMLGGRLKMPGDFFVVVFNSMNKDLKESLLQVPNSLIYSKST